MDKIAEEHLLKAIIIHGFKMERDFKTVDVSHLKNFLNSLEFTCADDNHENIVYNYHSPGFRHNILTLVLFNQYGTIVKVSHPEKQMACA